MMKPSMAMPGKRRTALIAAIVLLIVLLAVAAVVYFRQPSADDYKSARDTHVKDLKAAREALTPAVNKYLAAFKNSYNESKDLEGAVKDAKPEYDALKSAERKATEVLKQLTDNRVANAKDTSDAVDQLAHDYSAEVAYYAGMVESYADYTALFAQEEDRCSGIFIGQTDDLTDRKTKLDAAAKRCQVALDDLKQSGNETFVDYAKKVERRVKQLQSYAKVTADGESSVKDFEKELSTFQQRYADATARNAPDSEIMALADEIKQTNARIEESKAQFDFAASRYLSTVKEMPTLYGDVYDKNVPAKLKYFDQLIDGRIGVLELLLDAKLAS